MARESKGITLPIIYKANLDGLKQAEGALSGFGKNLAKVGAGIAAAFSIGAVVNFAKSAMLAAEEAQAVNNVLVQVAKNTLPVTANVEAATQRMIKFADSQEVLLGIDGEIIKSTQAKLLGFSNLASSANEVGGVFDRTLSASFDLAAATGKDVSAMSTALGKALEDPLSALGGLARGQVKFSESQQELIKGFVESGDLLAAQEVILSEVEGTFGGAAAAAAKGSERLANAMENLRETAGQPLLGVFADLVTGLQPVLEVVGTEIAKAFTELGPVLQDIVKQLPALITAFVPLIPILGTIAGVFLQLIAELLPPFVELFEQLLPVILELAPILADVFLRVLEALIPVFMELVTALMPIVSALLPVLADLIIALAPVIVSLVEAFLPLIELILPILIEMLETIIPVAVVIAEILSILLVNAINFLTESFEQFMAFLDPFIKFFEDKFGGLSTFFFGIVNGMIGMFEGFVNAVINGVNAMIRGLNRLSFEVPDWVQGPLAGKTVGFSIPELQNVTFPRVALAEGGLVTRPTSALIGEAGPEAVIPLDRLSNMGGATYNITIHAGMGTDGASLGRDIVSAIKKFERASGPVFASA